MIARAFALLWLGLLCVSPAQAADAAFTRWLESLWPSAQQLGVSRVTFDTATAGLDRGVQLLDGRFFENEGRIGRKRLVHWQRPGSAGPA